MAQPRSGLAESYREMGFVLARGLFGLDEVEALRGEAVRVCRGERGEIRGLDPAGAGESDEDVIRRTHIVQLPHKVSPVLYELLSHPAVTDVLRQIIGANVKCIHSILFLKGPGKPGQAWHQDEHYNPTRDRSLTGAWIALDEVSVENGCIWMIPGSHRQGVIWPNRTHGDSRFDEGYESYGFPFDEDDSVPVEMAAGDVVFFNGYLLHRSFPNRSSGCRRAIANHYMSAESMLPWDWDGRLPPTSDMRDIVMVCGTDPYAYKGTEDVLYAHRRGESEEDRHADDAKTRIRF